MSSKSLSRRDLVGYSAAIGAGAMLATTASEASARPAAPARTARPLAFQDEEVVYAKVIDTMPASFAESPMLAEQAKAGTIPALKDRLPEKPLVVQPIEIGQYGGTARVGNITTELGGYDLDFLVGRATHFLRYTPELNGWEPNVAESVDVSDDKKVYTIHMRKGLRWSDGEPCTADDLLFSINDLSLNKELTPTVPTDFRPGDVPVVAEKVDDYTVTLTFAVPHPRFLLSNLPHQYGWFEAHQLHPKHYLQQFHPKYNPKAEEEAKAAKFNSWTERMHDMDKHGTNAERPTLAAFYVEENTPTVVRYVRNPYFWQVDSEGNQLPYLDYVEMERLQNVETYHAKIVTGAYDYAVGNTDVLNFQTYDESAADGDYTVGIWSSGRGSEVFFQVNLNVEDESLRAVHQDVRYRRALSLAINREEMNDLLFFGQATIRQMTVLPTSINFKQEYADAFIDYDVDQANALLDEMGLTWNDDKTIRLRSDGKPMQITFDFFDGEGPKTSILELVSEYWRAIGIDVSAKSITRQLLNPRVTENKEAMSMWHGDASTDILLPVDRKWSIGKLGDECTVAPLWNDWFQSDGASGEEPPDWYKEPLMAWKKYNETLDPDAAAQLLQSQADNLWSIGTVGLTPWVMIAKNHVGNVPKTGIHTWDGLFQYPYHAETVFFRQ
ncbi:MAG TPA: ABC transporter substrate-binding protein [Thermomicrobiales bacterium]|nr:ABC transporter substrate-binding protein [Thermomicrobiales bacterium]